MPNKKNKQRNGFYYFMKEVLEDMARKGKTGYNMQNVAVIAHPLWQNLPQQEKDVYNSYAKKMKLETQESLENKRDCTGALVKEVLDEEQQKELFNNKKLRKIKSKIAKLMNESAVANEKFYVISFNIFCLTEENVYVPAEIGLIEYSISKGVTKEFHDFIDPGELPLGYTYICRHHSESSHLIPPQNFELSNKNYMLIYKSIKTFVSNNSQNTDLVVYCFPDEMDQVEGVLAWLQQHSLSKRNEFQVFDLSALLFELRMFKSKASVESLGITKDMLSKNVYDYVSNISCKWHEEKDVPNHCALGIAKRYCYLMSDHLCSLYGIDIIPNKHLPLQDEEENICVVDPLTVKMHTNLRPKPSRATSFPKSNISSQKTTKAVSNFPSKDDSEDEKVVGATSGTEKPKNLPKLADFGKCSFPLLSAANVVKRNEDFKLEDEDFPGLENLSLGRGRGRGLMSTVLDKSNVWPTKLSSVGIGRGNAWRQNQ